MKIAIVHDWLNQKAGGAESVLAHLAEMYPEAPIYTLIYNPELFDYPQERIHTSFLQRAPGWLKSRSRYLLPLIPNAVESWDFSEFDIVISSSCAFTKNIITHENTKHISYCHSPMRFAWDYWPRYIQEQNVGPVRRMAIRRILHRLRIWDYVGAARVDHFIANSKTTQARIEKYYRREASLIYPPVGAEVTEPTDGDYYVTLGMLTPYKKIDLAIEAFNISGKKLKIIGDGPDRQRLEALAAENVEFMGFVDEAKRTQLLRGSRGLIFPNVEDFGIAPVEAMAAGVPVIAYGEGGATETVIDRETGILFPTQTPEALNRAVMDAEEITFDTQALHKQAGNFDPQRFGNDVANIINQYVQE